jgi:hypothetical protein
MRVLVSQVQTIRKPAVRTTRAAERTSKICLDLSPTRALRELDTARKKGPDGAKTAAAGECSGGAGIRRGTRERLDAGAVAGRSAESVAIGLDVALNFPDARPLWRCRPQLAESGRSDRQSSRC